MAKKRLNLKSNKQKMIDELDPSKKGFVEVEVIEEQVETPKKQLREDLEPYKWKKGQTGNPRGRPKDPLKAIGLRIAQLKAHKVLTPEEEKYIQALGLETADLKVIEHIMVSLAMSSNPAKVEMFLDRVYGKVPNININAEISATLVAKFRNKFTDAELERIASGEDALDVLISKLPDVDHDEDEIVEAEE
jgi:hypothetical protein